MGSRPCLWALLLSLWACLGPSSASAEVRTGVLNAPPPGITLSYSVLPMGQLAPYTAVRFEIKNEGLDVPATVEVTSELLIVSGRWRFPSSLWQGTLRTGTTRIELLIPGQSLTGQCRAWLTLEGDKPRPLFLNPASLGGGLPMIRLVAEPPTILTANNADPPTVEIVSIPTDALPSHWQAHIGQQHLLVLGTHRLKELQPAQREAISRWVTLAGGNLFLVGEGAREAATALELPLPENARAADVLTGRVQLLSTEQLPSVGPLEAKYASAQGPAFALLYATHLLEGSDVDWRSHAIDWLEADLFDRPLFAFAILSVALCVVIGPLNLWYVRRKKRGILFYITAPLLGLAGVVVLALWSILGQGIDTRYNLDALLLADLYSGRGALYTAQMTYAGLEPEPLSLPEETLVVPFDANPMEPAAIAPRLYFGAGQRWTGWLEPRAPGGLLTVTPLRLRMEVALKPLTGGALEVTNHLPFTLKEAYLRLSDDDEEFFVLRDLAPGASRVVRERLTTGETGLESAVFHLSSTGVPSLHWRVLASLDGLPHLEASSLQGSARRQRFTYLAVAGATAVDPWPLEVPPIPNPTPSP